MIFSSAAIAKRKSRAAEALNKVLKDGEAVLVHCGNPIQKPGGHDQTYPFLPHPDYFWLTGSRRASGVSVYSQDNGWTDFVEPVGRDEKIWEGGGEAIPGIPASELQAWLLKKNFKTVFHLGQTPDSLNLHPERDDRLVHESFNSARRVKDTEEIALIRRLADMANAGYTTLQDFIREGVTERDIQIAYETAVLKAGSEKFPYETIVGTGSNAAILHAIPTKRSVKKDELVLIDGGADVQDYCVDVTRVFSAGGKFTSQQKAMIEIVMKAQSASIELCRPGVEWREVHLASAQVIAEGLYDLGLLKIKAEEAVTSEAVSLFFPHGVGHMVGLRVRDVGGTYNPNPKKYAGARLRVDIPLRENYLMTVEPGVYFIPALLQDQETRRRFEHAVHWNEAEKWLDAGGVRIEDDILISAEGPVNLTAVIGKNYLK